jgi:hypothetical protein
VSPTLRLLAGLAAAQVAALAACGPTGAEKSVVERWLLCEECTSGELNAVVALRDRATGRLDQALRDGPSDADRKRIGQHAESRYARLVARSPQRVTKLAWIDHYERSFVAHYQAHAALALGRIGTTRARKALLEAMQHETAYAPDVRRALGQAAPVVLAPVQGDSQSAPPGSFVRKPPTVIARDSATGQPLPDIRVTFRVDSGGGSADSVRRTNAQGLASVRWALGPGPDSLNVLRASAFRARLQFTATAHGPRPRLVFAVQPSDVGRGQPITPAVRVLVLDAWDQRDTTLHGTTEAVIVPGGQTVTGTADSGRVDLPPIIPTTAGSGFQIIARLTGATEAVSAAFDVAP